MNDSIQLVDYAPGAIGRITELHGTYYSANWGLGRAFEVKTAQDLGDFMYAYTPERDGVWFAQVNGVTVGSVLIDGRGDDPTEARLRYFIIDPAMHGRGLGTRLLTAAVDFCRNHPYRRVYLTTLEGLDAACHLYEKFGFQICSREPYSNVESAAPITQLTYELFFTS